MQAAAEAAHPTTKRRENNPNKEQIGRSAHKVLSDARFQQQYQHQVNTIPCLLFPKKKIPNKHQTQKTLSIRLFF